MEPKRLILGSFCFLLSVGIFAADINVTVVVDDTISSNLQTLCNRIRASGQYSSVGWTPTGSCAQAIFNAGILKLANEEARAIARSHAADQNVIKYNELYSPVEVGVALNEPPKAVCGDSNVDSEFGEECDSAGIQTAICEANCRTPRCADGILNTLAGEQCDDGNVIPGDGCNGTCQTE